MIPVPGKLPNAALLKKASAEFRGLGPGESRTERAKGFLSCRSAQHEAAVLVAVKRCDCFISSRTWRSMRLLFLQRPVGAKGLISPGMCR